MSCIPHARVFAHIPYIDVCDGAMIVLAMFTLNFFHPGFLLLPAKEEILSEHSASGVAQKTASDETDATADEKAEQD